MGLSNVRVFSVSTALQYEIDYHSVAEERARKIILETSIPDSVVAQKMMYFAAYLTFRSLLFIIVGATSFPLCSGNCCQNSM